MREDDEDGARWHCVEGVVGGQRTMGPFFVFLVFFFRGGSSSPVTVTRAFIYLFINALWQRPKVCKQPVLAA